MHSVHRGHLVFISLHCLNSFQTSEAAFIFYSCETIQELWQGYSVASKIQISCSLLFYSHELTIINYLMYPLYCWYTIVLVVSIWCSHPVAPTVGVHVTSSYINL